MDDQKNSSGIFFVTANPAGAGLVVELEQLGYRVAFCEAGQGTSSAQSFAGNSDMADSDTLVYWAPLPKVDHEIDGVSASAYVSSGMRPLFDACREFSKAVIRKKKPANIVTIIDFSAISGVLDYSIHSALTAGIVGFSKCLALELSKNNIRVNTICTGLIDGWISKEILGEPMQTYFQSMSLGRPVTLKSLAKTLSHVAGPDHSMTGAILQVDNGCVI